MVAGIGGAVTAMGWLPPHHPLLLVLGIATILYLCRTAEGIRNALFIGFFGALIFFIVINRPLVSAYSWGGWTNTGGMAPGSSAWWLLNTLWLVVSALGALFWVIALAIYWRLGSEKVWIRVTTISILWVVIAEWLRSIFHWGFEWGWLGIALIDLSTVSQWSSVFGVLFLSSLVVGSAALIVELISVKPHSRRLLLVVGAGFMLAIWTGGTLLQPLVTEEDRQHKVAAFQYSPSVPKAGTTALGISPLWFSILPQIVSRNYQLVVLPESISSHAIQFDQTTGEKLGGGRQIGEDSWQRVLSVVLKDHPNTLLALGTEGVEQRSVYNSTSIWNRDGLIGWQHKVRLVPFAEYLPAGWSVLGSRAVTYYEKGEKYSPISADQFQIGSFICQEVQYSGTARALVSKGANILITGGNDGVFSDPRVAGVHHSMARFRAIETGRYVVRATKDGISSIVSPAGEVVSRSPGHGAALVAASVSLPDNQTFWVRLGNWPIMIMALAYIAFLVLTAIRGK